jgi:hypothetical protein
MLQDIRDLKAAATDPYRATALPEHTDRMQMGPFPRRSKSPEIANQGLQRDAFYQTMLARKGLPIGGKIPDSWSGMPDREMLNLYAYAMNPDGYRDQQQSAYENTELLQPGDPLGDAMTTVQAGSAAVYEKGRELANRADALVSRLGGMKPGNPYPHASENAVRAFSTLLGPMRHAVDLPRSAWDDMDDERAAIDKGRAAFPTFSPFNDYAPDFRTQVQRAEELAHDYNLAPGDFMAQEGGTSLSDSFRRSGFAPELEAGHLTTGREFLEGAGVPYAAAGGIGLDMMTDPTSLLMIGPYRHAMRMSRLGDSAPFWGSVRGDFSLPAGMGILSELGRGGE